MKNLFWWELKTVPEEQWEPTQLPAAKLRQNSGICLIFAVFWALLMGFSPLILLCVPLLARMMALDAHYRILPHIYTIPFLVLGLWQGGLSAALHLGFLVTAGAIWFLLWRVGTGRWSKMGGGDILLLMGISTFAHGVTFAGILIFSLFFTDMTKKWVKKNQAPPFGPALGLGWICVLVLAEVWAFIWS